MTHKLEEIQNKTTTYNSLTAPGEARTHSIRIASSLALQGEGTVYKYGALTDCATGADV